MESPVILKPNWNLGDIYRQSWELTKTHKKLWILGLAVSVLVTTASSSNSSSRNNTQKNTSKPPTEASQSLKVFSQRFIGTVTPNLKDVPLATYPLIGLEFTALVAISIIISLTASAWSRAALMLGCSQALMTGETELISISKHARRQVKTVLRIDYLPWLKPLGILLIAALIGLIGALFKLPIILPLAMIVAVIIFIVRAFYIIVAQVWAYRFAVLNADTYPYAMELGAQTATGNVGKMLLLGLINALVSGLISLIIFLPFGSASAITVFMAINKPDTGSILSAAITVILSILVAKPLFGAKAAVMTVFSYFTWHLSFKALALQGATHETTA